MATIEQVALAQRLYDVGLAPKGVTLQNYMDGPVFWWGETRKWEPWRSWDAVAHLIEKYSMGIYQHEQWEITAIGAHGDGLRLFRAKAENFSGVPAAVARLALQLHDRATEIVP